MRLFDTHAHLLSEKFDEDRETLIGELSSRGLIGCIEVGTDVDNSDKAQRLAESADYIWAAIGVHPHDAGEAADGYIDNLAEIANRPKVVAIGEIGLDYYYDFSPREAQRQVFERQLELAQRLKLPVIIHMREATQDTLAILREHKGLRGVMHCFSGSAVTAEICLNLGLHVSFTGSVTFKNARKVAEAAALVPLDRLMAETDCPYLSPEPVRGRRNDPSNVRYVIEKLAEIKGVTADEMAEANIKNAKELFKIK
jgi:TatD DNase family protein